MKLEAKNIYFNFGNTLILENLSLDIPKNKISIILGPNGCGKSTLLKILARLYKPNSGKVLLDGQDINQASSKELAKKLSLMVQSPEIPEDITVKDLIFFGRHPYQKLFSRTDQRDIDAVERAISITRLTGLESRYLHQLSGGQRQRAWLAMAISQETEILLLDEPTTYLDLHYQFEILDLLKELNEKKKTTIVIVLHDLNLASLYADYLFILNKGLLHSEGVPSECLSSKLIENIFKIRVNKVKSANENPQFNFSSAYIS